MVLLSRWRQYTRTAGPPGMFTVVPKATTPPWRGCPKSQPQSSQEKASRRRITETSVRGNGLRMALLVVAGVDGVLSLNSRYSVT